MFNKLKPTVKPIIVVSRCLLGHKVRYDGQDKGQPELIQALAAQLQVDEVCPEVEAGLTIPRPPVRLIQTDQDEKIRAVGVENPELDVTETLLSQADSFVQQQAQSPWLAKPCGALLKARSPSCGTGNTPLWQPQHQGSQMAWGLFAQRLRSYQAFLPLVSEQYFFNDNSLDQSHAYHLTKLQRFVRACQLVQAWHYLSRNQRSSNTEEITQLSEEDYWQLINWQKDNLGQYFPEDFFKLRKPLSSDWIWSYWLPESIKQLLQNPV